MMNIHCKNCLLYRFMHCRGHHNKQNNYKWYDIRKYIKPRCYKGGKL